MLETHGLQVDAVESGEQALDYLRNSRPDVVFMDHLMPGIDGFDAIRAMKNNTQTANIPVMMYTSQEGEAYLRDARKVGAVGVLSKTLMPADVAHALYELNLLPERREERAALRRSGDTVVQLAATSVGRASNSYPSSNVSPITTSEAREQNESQRNWQANLQNKFEEFSARLNTELRVVLNQMQAANHLSATAKPTNGFFAVALVIVALLPTMVLGWLHWRAINDSKAQLEQAAARLAMVVTDQQTQIEQLRAELRQRQSEASTPVGADTANAALLQSIAVPYGELPLAGARTEHLRTLLDRLLTENFRGKIRVTTYIGDFCLSGNATNGFLLARENISLRRCDLIGNPFEDALSGAQRQSTEFANLLASAKIPVEVVGAGRKPPVSYPAQNESVTAGEWNRIAAQNNRVELATMLPTP